MSVETQCLCEFPICAPRPDGRSSSCSCPRLAAGDGGPPVLWDLRGGRIKNSDKGRRQCAARQGQCRQAGRAFDVFLARVRPDGVWYLLS